MLQAINLSKSFQMGDTTIHALDHVSFSIQPGEMAAIMGPSGSGKSTLMSIIGCLDVPSAGEYILDGEAVSGMSENQLADVRGRKIGFVFQHFNLLPRTSALDNVMLPLAYTGLNSASRARAASTLERVGLGSRIHHHPNELSGGQQQRVAIARALVNQPSIILADEPTGALDSRTGAEIMQLFQTLHRENRQTVILVTHDEFIAHHTGRIIRIADGRIISDEANPNPLSAGAHRPAETA